MKRPRPRRSLRIAMFTDTWYPSHNGVVTSTETFRRELEELGHQVHLFVPAAPGVPAEEGVTRVASVPFPAEPSCRVALPFPRSLILRFTRSHFDLIHTQTPFGLGLWGAALARMSRRPLIHTYHTFFEEYHHYLKVREEFGRAFAARYSRLYCNRCQAIVVPSPEFVDVLRSYRVKPRIEVIPTGLRLPATIPDRAAARAALGITGGEPMLLYVGRLAKEKSIEFLLEAFAILGQERRDVRLTLVGDGPHRHALEETAGRLGISDRVRFVGAVPHEQVWNWYAASDLFVFASRTETQGLVVAEALAAGLPVVAVKGPGVGDVAIPENGGVLTEPDLEAFLPAVRHLLDDEAARRDAAMLGRSAARQWSSRHSAERLVELYRKLLRRPTRRRIIRRALATVSARLGAVRYRRSVARA